MYELLSINGSSGGKIYLKYRYAEEDKDVILFPIKLAEPGGPSNDHLRIREPARLRILNPTTTRTFATILADFAHRKRDAKTSFPRSSFILDEKIAFREPQYMTHSTVVFGIFVSLQPLLYLVFSSPIRERREKQRHHGF